MPACSRKLPRPTAEDGAGGRLRAPPESRAIKQSPVADQVPGVVVADGNAGGAEVLIHDDVIPDVVGHRAPALTALGVVSDLEVVETGTDVGEREGVRH